MRRHAAGALLAWAGMAMALGVPQAVAEEDEDDAVAAPAGPVTTRKTAAISISEYSKAHAAIFHDAVAAVRKHQGYDPVDLGTVLNAGGDAEALSNLKTAQAFNQAGRAALGEGEFLDASEQFESAARLMEQNFGLLTDPAEYRTLLLELGAAHANGGDEEAALPWLRQAARMKADPALANMGAKGKALYEKVKAEVEGSGFGAVTIETEPPHAEIFVDGRYRGVAPQTVAGLFPGKHLFVFAHEGYAKKTVPISVNAEGGAPLEHESTLEPARKKILLDQLVPKLQSEAKAIGPDNRKGGEAIQKVGSLLFAEVALLIEASGDVAKQKRVKMYLFDTRSQQLLNTVDQTIDWSYRNRKAIRAAVDELLDIDYVAALGGETKIDPDVRGGGGGIATKWWFWTLVTVGVAGATAGIILATQSDDEAPPFTKDGTGAIVLQF